MAHVIELPNLRHGYLELIDFVKHHGTYVAPRGIATREIEDVTIEVKDPMDAVPVGVGRDLNLAIASAELTQLLGGYSDGAQLVSIAPIFKTFMDDTETRLLGAYGPRMFAQFPYLLEQLEKDNDTRQAVATIWKPEDLRTLSRDVPCTVALGYTVRDNKLHARTVMRSNDVWLGVPYDFAVFTAVHRSLAWALGVGVGRYVHQVWSLHIYDRDLDATTKLHDPSAAPPSTHPVPHIARTDVTRAVSDRMSAVRQRWQAVQSLARIAGLGLDTTQRLPDAVQLHRIRLDAHRSGGIMCQTCRYVLPRTAEFFHAHQQRQRYRGICRFCRDERYRVRVTSPAYQERRLQRRCARYGVTVEWYNTRLKEQQHRCGICERTPDNGRWKDFVIDHDHVTGLVRGLICSNCNQAIGLLDDDAARVMKLYDYLQTREAKI